MRRLWRLAVLGVIGLLRMGSTRPGDDVCALLASWGPGFTRAAHVCLEVRPLRAAATVGVTRRAHARAHAERYRREDSFGDELGRAALPAAAQLVQCRARVRTLFFYHRGGMSFDLSPHMRIARLYA